MSFDALAWAAKQKPGNLAAKMALLALANYANEAGEAYPSTAAIADFGDMNHKTATVALDRLEALGLVHDTGRKVGKSGQIKVYRLNLTSIPKTEPSQNREAPKFSIKDPQKRVTDTVREPVNKYTQTTREHEIPEGWKPAQFGLKTKSRAIVDGWPPGEAEAQLEHFTAHHRRSGQKFKDWQDAWSTWVLNSRRFGSVKNANRNSGNTGTRKNDGFGAVLRDIAGREASSYQT